MARHDTRDLGCGLHPIAFVPGAGAKHVSEQGSMLKCSPPHLIYDWGFRLQSRLLTLVPTLMLTTLLTTLLTPRQMVRLTKSCRCNSVNSIKELLLYQRTLYSIKELYQRTLSKNSIQRRLRKGFGFAYTNTSKYIFNTMHLLGMCAAP